MNTRGDTDEGGARPSVWPVYLAAVVIAVFALGGGPLFGPIFVEPHRVLYALFGILTCWGVFRLYQWGWWCALVWLIAYVMCLSNPPWLLILIKATLVEELDILLRLWLLVWLLVILAPIPLLVWTLATRRRLFFPAKIEHEE